MTIIEQLQEYPVIVPDKPRCQAMLGAEACAWRRESGSQFGSYQEGPAGQCHNQSSYKIKDKHYCRKHAGAAAIDVLLSMEESCE